MVAELPGYQDWFPDRELLTLLQSNLQKTSLDSHDENLQLSEIKTLLNRQKSDLLSSYTNKSPTAKANIGWEKFVHPVHSLFARARY